MAPILLENLCPAHDFYKGHGCPAQALVRRLTHRHAGRTRGTVAVYDMGRLELLDAIIATPATVNALTRAHTAFDTFAQLTHAPGNFRPTLKASNGGTVALLADLYDRAQERRCDDRRSYRY